MRQKFLKIATLMIAIGSQAIASEDAATERLKGIEALKASQSMPHEIVAAARHFAKASNLFMTAKDENKVSEMTSFLFWCKKKMSYQDIEELNKSGETQVVERLFRADKVVPEVDEAQVWFDRANTFATEYPTEHFLISIRFFEVASRFIGSKASLDAQERSLKEQQLAEDKKVAAAAAANTPALPAAPAVAPVAATVPTLTAAPLPIAAAPAPVGVDAVPVVGMKANAAKKINPADITDPLKKRIAVAHNLYNLEVEYARKLMSNGFDKREAEARRTGNKKIVDQVKEERATFETKRFAAQMLVFFPDSKKRIALAWKFVTSEYEAVVKEYTKAGKDVDAAAVEKEFNVLADEYAGATPAPAAAPAVAAAAGAVAAKVEAEPDGFHDKTYVAWLTLSNNRQRKGAVMGMENTAKQFDSMGYGELEPGKWMSSSETGLRSSKEQILSPVETASNNELIQMAIVYKDRDITIYHDGQKYAQYRIPGEPVKWGSDAVMLFGVRSLASTDYFIGSIADARVYSEALTDTQLKSLRMHTLSDPKPWAWFMVEDNAWRDHMGRFTPAKVTGTSRVQGSYLLLTGKGCFQATQIDAKKK